MHVLMTADAVGGVWTYAVELARALADDGSRVTLAVLGPAPTAAQRDEARAIPGLRLHEHAGRLEWMHDPWRDVGQAGAWLRALEAAVRPDVVHLNGYCHAAIGFEAPVLVVGHSCVRSWWRAVHDQEAPPEWGRYTRAVRRGLAAADLVVAPTVSMLASLEGAYGPLRRCRAIANGRTPPEAPPANGREPIVFAAGRVWDEAKNLTALCDVAPALAWPVYIAGDPSAPDGTSAFTPRGAHLLGRLPAAEVARWMSRASIYALPACYEPFGLSVLEAAQSGCALVVGDVPSLREVWGDAAVYVPPRNRRALAEAITRLIEDRPIREAMARQARARAADYTPARMASAYRAAYREARQARGVDQVAS